MKIFYNIQTISELTFAPESNPVLIDEEGQLWYDKKFKINLSQIYDLSPFFPNEDLEDKVNKLISEQIKYHKFKKITPQELLDKNPQDTELKKLLIPFFREEKIDAIISK